MTDGNGVQRDLGALEEAVDTLKREVSALRDDVAEIKSMMSNLRGGMKALMGVATVGGVIGSAATWLVARMKGL